MILVASEGDTRKHPWDWRSLISSTLQLANYIGIITYFSYNQKRSNLSSLEFIESANRIYRSLLRWTITRSPSSNVLKQWCQSTYLLYYLFAASNLSHTSLCNWVIYSCRVFEDLCIASGGSSHRSIIELKSFIYTITNRVRHIDLLAIILKENLA